MSRMIVAVGGTGQRVLLNYLQMYLLGVVDKPFHAILVDTDETLPPISAIAELFDLMQFGSDRKDGLGVELPSITTVPPRAGGGKTLLEVLTGNRELPSDRLHAAQAFFDRDTLDQDLNRGLFARPALSSVITQDSLRNVAFRPKPNSTVIFVGSVIGGTGGGLITPLVDIIDSFVNNEDIQNVKLRGVFFGNYFSPEPGRLEGDVARFRSSQMAVLKTMEDKLHALHSYCFIGADGRPVERDVDAERRGENLPWPRSGSHPFWRGLRAVDFLFNETAREKVRSFTNREFEEIEGGPSLDRARLRLDQGVEIARVLIRRRVLLHMAKENWPDSVWGRGLSDLVIAYWRAAARYEGLEQANRTFLSNTHTSLRRRWDGSGDTFGLSRVFPDVDTGQKTLPRHIRNLTWPASGEVGGMKGGLFEGNGEAANRLAACLLFWALRKGEL